MAYVRKRVATDLNSQQTPDYGFLSGHESGGDFVFQLPPALIGLTSDEHTELGGYLHQLGQTLADPYSFSAAQRHFARAIELAEKMGESAAKARIGQARSLLAQGVLDQAIQCLQPQVWGEMSLPGEAYLYLGLSYAKQGQEKQASKALKQFLELAPEHEDAAWIGEFLKSLVTPGEKYALLIGIGAYPNGVHVQGPESDVRRMQQLLTTTFDFAPDKIRILVNEQATRTEILAELDRLHQILTPADKVVIFFSGGGGEDDLVLLCYDTVVRNRDYENALHAGELHARLNGLPTPYVTLILDASPSGPLIQLARSNAQYTLLAAASPGQSIANLSVKDDAGVDEFPGHFTYSLTNELARSKQRVRPWRKIMESVTEQMLARPWTGSVQTPLFVGNEQQAPLRGENFYLRFYDLAERRNFDTLTLEEVHNLFAHLRFLRSTRFPRLNYSLGKAFLHKGDYEASVPALERAIEQSSSVYLPARLDLIQTQILRKRPDLAQDLLDTFPPYEMEQIQEASLAGIKEIVHRQAAKRRPRVLLVAADAQFYTNEQAIRSNEYIEQLKALFTEKYAVEPENIVTIEMKDATSQGIVQSLEELLKQAANEVVFFYFIGGMTLVERSDHDGAKSPALVGIQLGQESHYIDLIELAQIAEASSADLLTLFDTLWVEPLKGGNASERGRVFSPVTGAPPDLHERFPAIGVFSLYATALDPGWLTQWFGMQLEAAEVPPSYRMLAASLRTDRLTERGLASSTDAGADLQVVARGAVTKTDLPFFQSLRLQHQTRALFASIQRDFLARAIALLEALHQRSEAPEADDFLNLGIAYAGSGDIEASRAILESAISLHPDDLRLRYHLGRILYENGQLPGRAIAELTHVVEKDIENARAYYYLGQSIRALIFQESLQKAEEMLRRYLEKGAPLGQVAAIQAFLDEREAVSRSAAPADEDRW